MSNCLPKSWVNQNGSRGKETVTNKTKTQGKSFLFLVLSKKGI